MDWLRKAWAWICVGRRWLILPAVVAGVAAMIGLLRGRRTGSSLPGSVPVAGLSPSQAQGLRDDAAATHAVEVAEADRELAASRALIEAARKRKEGGS